MKEDILENKAIPQNTAEADKTIKSARISVGIRHEIVNGGGLLLDSQMARIAISYQSDQELHRAIRARGRIRLNPGRQNNYQ